MHREILDPYFTLDPLRAPPCAGHDNGPVVGEPPSQGEFNWKHQATEMCARVAERRLKCLSYKEARLRKVVVFEAYGGHLEMVEAL